jgi:uncharacterized protein YjbI with pentapeptide repeats
MRRLILAALLMVIGPTAAVVNEAEAQSNDAQQELLRAQTDYYRAQTTKLSRGDSLLQNLRENPASTVGILGALVALISFAFNYRVTLRNQRDTQFYEALKRFGDKDSPSVRASATGLIAQMALVKVVSLKKQRPYFETAFSQLTTGLLLEGNYVALLAVRDALGGLIDLDLMSALKRLYESNLKLQEDACITLAKFCVATGKSEAKVPRMISEEAWNQAESVTLHKTKVLEYLATRNQELFSYFSVSHRLTFMVMSKEQRADNLISAQQSLRNAFNRLDINVELCSHAFKTLSRHGSTGNLARSLKTVFGRVLPAGEQTQLIYDNIFLARADLSSVHLKNIRMQNAQLQEANLSRSWFETVDLYGAQLDGASLSSSYWKGSDLRETQLNNTKIRGASWSDNTRMEGANWWSADFYDPQKNVSDELLRGFYRIYLFPKDLDLSKVHASARSFVEERMEFVANH